MQGGTKGRERARTENRRRRRKGDRKRRDRLSSQRAGVIMTPKHREKPVPQQRSFMAGLVQGRTEQMLAGRSSLVKVGGEERRVKAEKRFQRNGEWQNHLCPHLQLPLRSKRRWWWILGVLFRPVARPIFLTWTPARVHGKRKPSQKKASFLLPCHRTFSLLLLPSTQWSSTAS